MPEDLTGKSFIDIGCWEGEFCKQAVRRGATQVVGIDMCTSPQLKQNIKEHKFDFIQMDIQSEKFLTLPRFDIVSFCGVLYHLENPISALYRIRTICRQKLYIESLISLKHQDSSMMEFFPGMPSRWWAPNQKCMEDMLRVTGFGDIKEAYFQGEGKMGRLCLHAKPVKVGTFEKAAPRRPHRMELAGGTRDTGTPTDE